MKDSNQNITNHDLDIHIFHKSVHMQIMLQGLRRAIGELNNQNCLAIGSPNSMMSYQLRTGGGFWKELVFDAEIAKKVKELTEDDEIKLFDGSDSLPYTGKCFDIIVIMDGFPKDKSDYDFIEMCHKILNPDGRIIVCVPREKKISLIGPLRSLFGLSTNVYSERRLFDILKNGFDVMQMRSSSRFFIELVNTIACGITNKRQEGDSAAQMQLYKILFPFYWIAYQLDLLIFLTRGHRLIASAKRHAWRSRDAPILSDGRSMSEAVLKPLGG
jgi:hypothetical protein